MQSNTHRGRQSGGAGELGIRNRGSSSNGDSGGFSNPPREGNNNNINNAATNSGRRMTQPTPLFERLVTEEVQELKAYARIIENQNRRLGELERVHGDLETRLELESRSRVQLETALEEQEREWALKFQQLEAERDRWKDVVKAEQAKNAKLIDQVVRKDQDIHRMLQRKYDNQRETPTTSTAGGGGGGGGSSGGGGGGSLNHSIRNTRHSMNDRSMQYSSENLREQQFISPHRLLVAGGSMEAVRIRNVKNMLKDFFAM